MSRWAPARLVASAALVAGMAGLAGCGGVGTLSFPPPPTTAAASADTTPTVPPGAASASEATVDGEPTTTAVAIGPGDAALDGTVLGPTGPIAGATVLAERLVGEQEASTEAATAADGSWSIHGILGGRYRLRAWLAPTLALTTPQVFFLGAHDSRTVTMQLSSFAGPKLQVATSPASPVAGEPVNLVVEVTNPTVGQDGVVRQAPVVGVSVTLADGPGWRISNGNPQTTDADGEVLFEATCTLVGDDPLAAAVGGSGALPLTVPTCGPPPPPPTTREAPSTTSPPTTSPSTTSPTT